MDQVTPKPLEDDVDSTQSSSSADSVDVNRLIDVSPPQEPETSGNDSGPESDENSSEIEDETSSHPNGNVSSITNPSVGAGEPTEIPLLDTPVSEPISPAEAALEVIKNQDTHCLYCSICKSNITKDAVLFKKGEETYPYNTPPYVMWVLRFNLSWIPPFNLSWIPGFDLSWIPPFNLSWIPGFDLSWIPRNFKGLWKKLKTLGLKCLPRLSRPTSLHLPLRFLLVAVLLLLSVIVLWPSQDTSSPSSSPVLPSPSPSPSPLPAPVPPSSSPLPSPVPPSPWPYPSPLPSPVPPSPSPSPSPVLPSPSPSPSPSPLPRRDPYSIISWLIHFPSINIKYLSVFSLLFLAILAFPWHSISTSIDSLIKAAIERCRGIENPIRPFCRKARDLINAVKARVTPDPKPNPKPDPKPNPKPDPKPNPKPDPKPNPDQDPEPNPPPSPPPAPTPPYIPIFEKLVVVLPRYIVDRLRNQDILKSIIYGGLIESITSLGVVSSAAASGASTLNVFALGVTSLFSGFILMCHSLLELKAKHLEAEKRAKDNPGQKKEETPYQTQLGNYRNVILHWVVVLTSFLVFGVIPPLCYGLFFRETDKGHYKAALVLAVSLVCVILLSSAKVYAFKLKNKFRTVAEYTGMAFGASALSFITSHFFSEMLEKYGFRKPASD